MIPINDVMNGYQLLRESDHYQQIRIRGEERHLMNNINDRSALWKISGLLHH